jgi:phage terminase large subunit-like protein
VLGREGDTGRWLHWGHAWCQPDVLDLRKDIAARLHDFVRDGDLTICDGNKRYHETPAPSFLGLPPGAPWQVAELDQDVDELAAIIARIHDAGLLPAKYGVGLDPVGVSAIVDACAARGVEVEANGGPVCAVSQGYKLSGAVWGMERMLKSGKFRHAGRGLMAWCVGNAKVEARGNAVLITKQAAGKAKIDPLMAAFNAFALMSRGPEASAPKVVDYVRGQLFA